MPSAEFPAPAHVYPHWQALWRQIHARFADRLVAGGISLDSLDRLASVLGLNFASKPPKQ